MHATFGRMAALLLVMASTSCGVFVARPRGDADIITLEEMQQNRFMNAYDAIAALHSNWMLVKPKTFGTTTGGQQPQVIVYVDENRMPNGDDDLRTIEVQRIQYIRHYDPVAATQRFGVGHTEGAIQVSTQPM